MRLTCRSFRMMSTVILCCSAARAAARACSLRNG
nr:MAG TPA: hypothetical protein [Caudoviricetes sp.]